MFRHATLCLLACALGVAQPAAYAAKDWIVLRGCEFVPENYHDGDSFSLRTRKKDAKRAYTYIFRLYGADCPESTDTQEPARIAEQAHYFRLPQAEVSKWGRAATAFTVKALQEAKDITVITRKTEARGQSRKNRYYAFVEVDGKDLAELLVENGLARAYGMSAEYDGRAGENYQRLLDRKERSAKRSRSGLWKESQLPQ
jgi:endonuclease YncB( thermonuclease family)